MNDEIQVLKNSKKQLDDYFEMLLSGKHETDYIVGKVERWAGVIKHDAKFADKQIKKQKEQNVKK